MTDEAQTEETEEAQTEAVDRATIESAIAHRPLLHWQTAKSLAAALGVSQQSVTRAALLLDEGATCEGYRILRTPMNDRLRDLLDRANDDPKHCKFAYRVASLSDDEEAARQAAASSLVQHLAKLDATKERVAQLEELRDVLTQEAVQLRSERAQLIEEVNDLIQRRAQLQAQQGLAHEGHPGSAIALPIVDLFKLVQVLGSVRSTEAEVQVNHLHDLLKAHYGEGTEERRSKTPTQKGEGWPNDMFALAAKVSAPLSKITGVPATPDVEGAVDEPPCDDCGMHGVHTQDCEGAS